MLFKPPPPGTKTNRAMLAMPPQVPISLQGGSQHLPSIKVEKPTPLQEFNEEGSALFCTQCVTQHFLACSDFLSFSLLYSLPLFPLATLKEWSIYSGLKPAQAHSVLSVRKQQYHASPQHRVSSMHQSCKAA